MSGLQPRPAKDRAQWSRQVAAAQTDAPREAAAPVRPGPAPVTPVPAPAARANTPAPPDPVAASLAALAGKASAPPARFAWTAAGSLSVQTSAGHTSTAQTRSGVAPRNGVGAHLEAAARSLLGDAVQLQRVQLATVLADLTAALAAGHTVLAGGDDDHPEDRHRRPRVVQVVSLTDGDPPQILIADADRAAVAVTLDAFCAEFVALATAPGP